MVTVGTGTGQCGNSKKVQDVGGNSRDRYMSVWQKWRQVRQFGNSRDRYRSVVTVETGTCQCGNIRDWDRSVW